MIWMGKHHHRLKTAAPLDPSMWSTPSNRSTPGAKRCKKCFITAKVCGFPSWKMEGMGSPHENVCLFRTRFKSLFCRVYHFQENPQCVFSCWTNVALFVYRTSQLLQEVQGEAIADAEQRFLSCNPSVPACAPRTNAGTMSKNSNKSPERL